MKIDIWSDYACPFCYIGEKRLLTALEDLGLSEQTQINYRNFQLDPEAVAHPDEDIHTLLAKKYKITYDQAKMNNERVISEAKKSGLAYDFDQIKPNNTRLAHELTRYAKDEGKEEAMAESLFSAYFEKGVDIGNLTNLVDLATGIGLDGDRVCEVLEEGLYKDVVEEDQRLAYKMGISSVPYFVIDNKYAISGAQSQAHFNQAIAGIRAKEV